MPQSLGQLFVHIVFSTKHRIPYLENPVIREEMHAYLAGACHRSGCPALRVGGIEDHVHIACRLSRRVAIANLVQSLKRESSKWIKRKGSEFESFYWQSGYGAFSVSSAHVTALENYILRQEEHHRTEAFDDEYRRILKNYGIDYDERYLWD